MKRRVGIAAAMLLVAALAGCASVAPLSPASPGESISGRMSLHVEPIGMERSHAFAAAFDLRGDPEAGVLGLSTPLGNILAQARWTPGAVELVTPQGTRRFTDLGALTRDVLGESVPVEAWFDWLRGRPWAQAPSEPAPGGHGFEQLGWQVDLARLDDGAIVATRTEPAPTVTVRVQLDRP